MDDRRVELPRTPVSGTSAGSADTQVLQLHAEAVAVSKSVRKTLVRATRTTRSRDQLVEQDLVRESVVVDRITINRIVDAVPPVREEGEVTIVPVVEEVVVIERRLVLKEEVHLRRVRTTERHTETVALREQEIAITRTALED